jgi:uncharacterized protein (TIGR02646 family)
VDEENKLTRPLALQRTPVKKKSRYSDYREELRRDCWYACSYCSMTEIESQGIGFEIDHYIPQKKAPSLVNEYDNLFWSCEVCNRRKGDYHPNSLQEQKGYKILRIDNDSMEDHFVLSDLNLSGLTETGNFNINWLDLNRYALRHIRELRKRLWDAEGIIINGIRTILAISIDSFGPEIRPIINKDRDELKSRQVELMDYLQDYVRQNSQSLMLDPDPENGSVASERRKYLLESGALTVDYSKGHAKGISPKKARRSK